MKILIVHNKYQSNNIGGEDIVYRNELELLQKYRGRENVLAYQVSNNDINKIKLLWEIWFSFKHYKNIFKIVQENKVDIVHIHNFFPLLTPSVFKAAKDGGAMVVHTLHNYRLWCISAIFYRDGYGICENCIQNRFSLSGVLNKCYRKSLIQSFFAQMAFWFYKVTKLFDHIDYFFVLTNFQKDKVKALGIDEKKIILKPNSLQTDLLAEQSRAEQSRAEQSRAEQSRAEQSRAEQSRAEQSRAEQSRAEQSRAEQSRAEQSRAEQSRAEQSRAEQSRAEQSRAEQSRAEQSRAEQSRAEQSRAEQSRAEQSRAEQSRAEQSRAEQSRAEQSRAEQSRAEQSRAEQSRLYICRKA